MGAVWEKVRKLELPAGDYVLFGSAPLAVRGLIDSLSDLDILARGAAWARACRLGQPETAPLGDRVVRLEQGFIEIFDAWMGLPPDPIIDRAERIVGLPFAALEDVLAYKRLLGREKDLEHIRRIEAYLTNQRKRG